MDFFFKRKKKSESNGEKTNINFKNKTKNEIVQVRYFF